MIAQGIGVYVLAAIFMLGLCCFGTLLMFLLFSLVTIRDRRRLRERTVISHVSSVIAQDLPLAPALAAAAASERGPVSRVLDALAYANARGRSLGEAFAREYPECSGMTRSLIAAGERTRQLPATLELAERTLAEREAHEQRIGRGAAAYAALVLAVTGVTVSLILLRIIPKYEEIFVDFGTRLPTLTVTVLAGGRVLGGLGALLCGIVVVLTPIVAYLRVRARRPGDPRWTSQVADSLRWYLPGIHRMQLAEGLALTLRTIRAAVVAGMPLPDAARVAAELDVNIHLRERIREFALRIGRGENAARAANRCGLGNLTALALAAGTRTGDMPAALRYAAEYHAAQVCRWYTVLRQVVWPVCTLALATIVGIVVYALFSPLVMLIDAVAAS